jgi:hypothetical protein
VKKHKLCKNKEKTWECTVKTNEIYGDIMQKYRGKIRGSMIKRKEYCRNYETVL